MGFKLSGALSNHLSKVHPDQQLPRKEMKRKRPASETDSDEEDDIAQAGLLSSPLTVEDLRRIFPSFPVSEFESPSAHDVIPNEHRQLMSCEGMGDNITVSDGQQRKNTIEHFPADLEAGKAHASHPFQTRLASHCFLPFDNKYDYKLARFFHLAHVPKVCIDEFFKDGVMGGSKRCVQAARPDLGTRCAPNLKFPTFLFSSAHTLYNKIDRMTADPQ